MEQIEKKITIENHLRYIEEMSYFGWEATNILKKDDGFAYITLQRDPEMPHYEEIKELENKWFSYDYPPLWPMIVLTILAFGLITALLVVWIMTKDNFNMKLWLLSLGLPAFICITLSTVWFAFRVSRMKKVLENIDADRIKIKQALEDLKVKDENQDKTQDTKN